MDAAVILGVILLVLAVFIAGAVITLTGPRRPRRREERPAGRPEGRPARPAGADAEHAAELAPPASPSPETPTAPGPSGVPAALPARYNEDFLALLVRDPWWLFAYWEVTPSRELEVEGAVGAEAYAFSEPALRLYDETAGDAWDIAISGNADNWYLNPARPGHNFAAEIGRRSRSGQFWALLRSNLVTAPPDGPAEGDEGEWACPPELYARLFPPGYWRRIGTSSPRMEWVPRQGAPPGAGFSPGPWGARR